MKVLQEPQISRLDYAKNNSNVIKETKPCGQRDLSCSGKSADMPPR